MYKCDLQGPINSEPIPFLVPLQNLIMHNFKVNFHIYIHMYYYI